MDEFQEKSLDEIFEMNGKESCYISMTCTLEGGEEKLANIPPVKLMKK